MTLTQLRDDIEALKRQESYASAMALLVHCCDEIGQLTVKTDGLKSDRLQLVDELLRHRSAAADEITRLTAENDRLRKRVEELERVLRDCKPFVATYDNLVRAIEAALETKP